MRKLFVIWFLSMLSLTVFSQTGQIEKLRKQQMELQEDIKNTNRQFLEVKKQTTTIIQRINLINKQISSRKEMMALQNSEIAALENEQQRLEKEIIRLNEELKQKQDSYANAIRTLYINRQGRNELFFVLSGKSAGELLRRMQYLKEYSKWRKNQAEEIKQKNTQIKTKVAELEQAKVDKQKALLSLKEEQTKLINEENTRQVEVNQARGKQKELQKILQNKQQQAKKLDNQIEKLIAEEVARQEREAEARRAAEARRKAELAAAEKARRDAEARKKEIVKTEPDKKETAKVETEKTEIRQPEPKIETAKTSVDETFKLSSNFVSNKGKLPMPVTGTSSIVSQFGVNKHSEWNISTNSNGIDIQSDRGANIRSVFEGEVSKVFSFAGMNTCVIVRHGEYYTFYANIYDIYVKPGDKVKTGQSLGKIYTDPDTGISMMHFQLWQKTNKLNPTPWLKR